VEQLLRGGITMTVRVRIGPIEKDIADADPAWINEQIDAMRKESALACVQVTIRERTVHMVLVTAGCPGAGEAGHLLSSEEERLLNLWDQFHLNDETFSGEDLTAFLRQIDGSDRL